MIHEQIKEEVKNAMREKNEVKLLTLRGLLAAFTNEAVTQKQKPDEMLVDEVALAVIKRQVKQRKDSIDQFEKGGRGDLAEDEKKELAILTPFLPQELSREEIEKIARAKMSELGITDKSKMGMLMGAVVKEAKGNADGALVKEVVEGLLS
jgi:uncharacterized protein YqeY